MGGYYLSRMPFPPPPPTILSCNFQPPTPSRFLYDAWFKQVFYDNDNDSCHCLKILYLINTFPKTSSSGNPRIKWQRVDKTCFLSHPASAAITWCWSKLISIQLLSLRLPTILVLCCCVVTLIWLHCVLYWTPGRRRMFWLCVWLSTHSAATVKLTKGLSNGSTVQ